MDISTTDFLAMQSPHEECPGREGDTLESQSLRRTLKIEKTGVSGGLLQDSNAAGENNGIMYTSHSHGDTYNIYYTMQQQRQLSSGSKGSIKDWCYADNDELVHHWTTKIMKDEKPRSCVDKSQQNNSSQDESSEDEFYDAVSTPSPSPPQTSQDKFCGNDVDYVPIPRRASMADIVAMIKKLQISDAEGTEVSRQFGIQMRERDEPDIPLNINGHKCVPPSDRTPGQLGIGALVDDESTFKVCLKKVMYERRLIAKGSIEDTVLIAELSAVESEKVFYFLYDLYMERISLYSGEQAPIPIPMEGSNAFDYAFVDLRNIKCKIIRVKTKQNVEKIVFLAENWYEALIYLSKRLTKTVFDLRKTIDPI